VKEHGCVTLNSVATRLGLPPCQSITTMSGLNPPSIKLPGLSIHPPSNNNNPIHQRRGRSNSFLKVEHVDSSNEEALDQAAYANINAEWVNRKGGSSKHQTDEFMV
jgi:hypothetical protein